MLSYTATNDKELLDGLNSEIFRLPFDGQIGYVLFDGQAPVGIASVSVTPEVSVLKSVGILPSHRGKRYGDFFTRSLLYGCSGVSEKLVVAYSDGYFEKFGFVEKDGKMEIESKNLTFPCECGKGGHSGK